MRRRARRIVAGRSLTSWANAGRPSTVSASAACLPNTPTRRFRRFVAAGPGLGGYHAACGGSEPPRGVWRRASPSLHVGPSQTASAGQIGLSHQADQTPEGRAISPWVRAPEFARQPRCAPAPVLGSVAKRFIEGRQPRGDPNARDFADVVRALPQRARDRDREVLVTAHVREIHAH